MCLRQLHKTRIVQASITRRIKRNPGVLGIHLATLVNAKPTDRINKIHAQSTMFDFTSSEKRTKHSTVEKRE
eukprot:m.103649 g.103649  ORF g.103649 m.103649 type:complete len:72 (-) comp13245_c1_seq2:646-861(-)